MNNALLTQVKQSNQACPYPVHVSIPVQFSQHYIYIYDFVQFISVFITNEKLVEVDVIHTKQFIKGTS